VWNTIANSNGESDCNCHGNCYSYSYCDSHSYSYTDTYAYRYLDPETHPDATVSAHSEGSSDSAAATVSLGSQVISCSHGSVSRVTR